MIYLDNIDVDSYIVKVKDSHKEIGYVYKEVDGYYVYQSKTNPGFFTSQFMKEMSTQLEHMNKEWNDKVQSMDEEDECWDYGDWSLNQE